MMRAPTLAAIYAVEIKVAQFKGNTRESLRRVPVAFRATLLRPPTLALIAAAAGLIGFWLIRRPQPQAKSSHDGVTVAPTTSAFGLLLAFIVRYGMRRIPIIVQQVWAAREKRAEPVGPAMSNTPATGYSAMGVRHCHVQSDKGADATLRGAQ